MNNQKEALEYLIGIGEENNPIVELRNGIFSKVKLNRITQPTAEPLKVSTLTGIVDYLKSHIDQLRGGILIQVKDYDAVVVCSELNEDRNRELYLVAEAILPNNIRYDSFLDTERFNIMLQSSFVDAGDKEVLLKYTGLVKDEAVKNIGDDGISQQVTVKTGVASVSQAIVPNPVRLAPFRTFSEVKQPLSSFIFRMQDGPKAAIYEADGGAWRNEAIQNIKKYLEEELKELIEKEFIRIIA